MNHYMNEVALSTFSYFDTGKNIQMSWHQSDFIMALYWAYGGTARELCDSFQPGKRFWTLRYYADSASSKGRQSAGYGSGNSSFNNEKIHHYGFD